MKKINLGKVQEGINQHSLKEFAQTSTHNVTREVSRDLTEKAWPKLQAMYGYKFTSQFGEMPDSTWVSCLRGITARQIADGLNNCLEMHPEWPPGAAQFRSACLGMFIDKDGNDSSWQHSSGAYSAYKPERRLESRIDTSKRRTAGKSALANMRGMFP